MVRRKGTVFVVCDKSPKHKQRQGVHAAAAATEVGAGVAAGARELLPPAAACVSRCESSATALGLHALASATRADGPACSWRSVAETVPGMTPAQALQLTRELQGLGPR